MADNDLGIILFRYVDWLHRRGYGRATIQQYTQAVEHFGFWRGQRRPHSPRIQPAEVAEFLTSHLSRCHCPPPAVTTLKTCRSALNRLMTLLGCRAPSAPSCQAERSIGRLVAEFDRHLQRVCGLGAATRLYRRRYAREFLQWRFKGKRWDRTKLGFVDFLTYVQARAAQLQPASVGVMVSSLRSLVRFLEFAGRCRAGLAQAWPTLPNWKQSPPAKVLTPTQCRALLKSVDRHGPAGQRDFAILRLLTDLGLRSSEVVTLCLEDIDWRAGTVSIRKTKQRRERLLPLPPLAAKAILAYLRTGHGAQRPERGWSASTAPQLCHPVAHPGRLAQRGGRCPGPSAF